MKSNVTASEFARRFGHYQMVAQRHPVPVESHGRITGYFICAEEYLEFKRFKDSKRAFATAELSDDEARALEAAKMDPRHEHLNALMDD